MGKNISLFTDFSQGENRITNYCGLMLKLLYQESPIAFEVAINALLEDSRQITVNPVFQQQERAGNSVPDMSISQHSFQLLFEVKKTDWFYSDQIKRHIDGLAENKSDRKILFLLCNDELQNYDARFEETIQYAERKTITISPITFEALLSAIKKASERLNDRFNVMIEDFEAYLNSVDVLPGWKNLLDVISCSGTLHSEVEKGTYMCPATGGSYAHKRAKFFGAYANKQVLYVAEIRAVVIVGCSDGNKLEIKSTKWNNTDEVIKDLEIEAIQSIENRRAERKNETESVGTQVFLLGKLYKTNFVKDSSGGLMGSKIYFKNIPQDIKSAEQLAKYLSGKSWSDLGK